MTADEVMFFRAMPGAFPLYETLWGNVLAECPDTTLNVHKSQITFRAHYGYAFVSLRRMKGCPKVFLIVSFGLSHRLDAPRITAAAEPYPNRWTHHVIVSEKEQLDDALMGWLREAYRFALLRYGAGLALEPDDHEFRTLSREIEAGASLEAMEYHWIDPDCDRALQNGFNKEADDKRQAISCIVLDPESLKWVKELFQPADWIADTPYCSFHMPVRFICRLCAAAAVSVEQGTADRRSESGMGHRPLPQKRKRSRKTTTM